MFKKIALAAFVLSTFVGGVAQADTVSVDSKGLAATTGDSAFKLSVSGAVGFTPTANEISVKIAGKTCTMGSSTQGSVPTGCNYLLTVTPDGVEISPTVAGPVCEKIKMTCN